MKANIRVELAWKEFCDQGKKHKNEISMKKIRCLGKARYSNKLIFKQSYLYFIC